MMRLLVGTATVLLLVLAMACVGDDPGATPGDTPDGSSQNDGDPSGNDGGEGGATCAAPKTTCGTACVDTQSDAAHCGACDKPCAGGAKCFEGVCNGQAVKAVAAASTSACVVRESGSVWCWGENFYRALGTKDVPNSPTPRRVQGLPKIVKLAGGWDAMCAISEVGEVYCWGRNAANLLGKIPTEICGNEPCVPVPAKMPNVPAMIDVSLGLGTACMRSTMGEIYCQGDNSHNQLGPNASGDPGTPIKVPLPNNVAANSIGIGVGPKPHVCVTSGGKLYCWGANTSKQIKDGTFQTCTGGAACITSPTEVNPGLSPLDQVVPGDDHTCVRGNGTVRCWGYGGYGVGPGDNSQKVITGFATATTIGGRNNHVCARKPNGEVSCIGLSLDGRLGFKKDPVTGPYPAPCNGFPCEPTAQIVPTLNANEVDALGAFSVALRPDGTVAVWGSNVNGLLGHPGGTGNDQSCPVPNSPSSPCQPTPQVVQMP